MLVSLQQKNNKDQAEASIYLQELCSNHLILEDFRGEPCGEEPILSRR